MKKEIVLMLFSTFSMNVCIGEVLAPKIKLDVVVQHEDGTPFEGATVRVTYPRVNHADNKTYEKVSDQEGKVSFTGRTSLGPSLSASHDGYYTSRLKRISIGEYDRQKRRFIYSDPKVTLVLREIKNPVAMYACREAKAEVPELHKPFGYDLLKGDWVAPHGEGKVADLLFKVTGEWTSFANHDSYLHITFPNPGDGIRSFTADGQSAFKSPYEAPVDGYASEKSLRKARTSVPVEGFLNKFETTIIDDTSHAANYIIRVRTVLDDNGEVKEALYGKIYGDFIFYGATLEKRYRPIVFSYYLNPTPNDRNLEYDPKRNLMRGPKSWNDPDLP